MADLLFLFFFAARERYVRSVGMINATDAATDLLEGMEASRRIPVRGGVNATLSPAGRMRTGLPTRRRKLRQRPRLHATPDWSAVSARHRKEASMGA